MPPFCCDPAAPSAGWAVASACGFAFGDFDSFATAGAAVRSSAAAMTRRILCMGRACRKIADIGLIDEYAGLRKPALHHAREQAVSLLHTCGGTKADAVDRSTADLEASDLD